MILKTNDFAYNMTYFCNLIKRDIYTKQDMSIKTLVHQSMMLADTGKYDATCTEITSV